MATKRLMVEELKAGMLLAEPLVIRNHVILNSGELLTKDALDQLINYGELFTVNVFLFDEDQVDFEETKNEMGDGLEDKITDFPLATRTLDDYSKEEKKVVVEKYVGTVSYVKNVFDVARQFQTASFEDMMETTKDTIEGLLENYTLVHAVKNLRGSDDYTYQHSVNVGILAGMIGRWLKMDKDRIQMLVMSGIMNDIGKSQIPLEILNKPGKLTPDEFEIMKKHTVYGYEILRKVKDIPKEVALAALQHHERIDGSGYPLQLTSERITDFGKIIAVADTYDAVTTDRVYQPRRAPLAVMEILDDEMFKKMDARSCLSMLVQIRDSLTDKQVVLKNGEKATIVFVGKHGTDELVVKTEEGRFINIGKSNYGREIAKYMG